MREPDPVATVDAQVRQLSELLGNGQRHVHATGRASSRGCRHLGARGQYARGRDGRCLVRQPAWRLADGPARSSFAGLATTIPRSSATRCRSSLAGPAGLRPGLLVADARNMYLLRFDPPGFEELATGAEMVASRFFYALGYHVGENYIVRLNRRQLVASEAGQAVSDAGRTRALTELDIDRFLRTVAAGPGSRIGAVATRLPQAETRVLGPHQVSASAATIPTTWCRTSIAATSGLFVFCMAQPQQHAGSEQRRPPPDESGVPSIRHNLLDFTTALGSGVLEGPSARGRAASVSTPASRRSQPTCWVSASTRRRGCAPSIGDCAVSATSTMRRLIRSAGRRIT